MYGLLQIDVHTNVVYNSYIMKSLHKSYDISAPVSHVWHALVTPNDIVGWGAGPAKMSDKAGSQFSLWGGDIHGANIEVIKEKKLVQEWYGGDWPEPSVVTITLSKTKEGTHVDLSHAHIPDGEASGIDDGWDNYYFGPMKEYLQTT